MIALHDSHPTIGVGRRILNPERTAYNSDEPTTLTITATTATVGGLWVVRLEGRRHHAPHDLISKQVTVTTESDWSPWFIHEQKGNDHDR